MAVVQNLSIADGQVAASATEILAGPATVAQRVDVRFTNVGGSSETLVVTYTRNGGTARRIFRAVLSANEQAYITGLPINLADSLLAATSNAASVDYTVSYSTDGTPFSVKVLDANGSLKSGSAAFSGALTLGSDVTVTNSAGVTNLVWDASEVPSLWANAPNGFNPDPSVFFEVSDDFCNPVTTAISDTHAWTPLNDGGTGTPVFQDAAGGIFNTVTAAADNDYSAYSSVTEPFKFAAGKKLWFEARFKLAEATTNESAWWFGLTDTLTTGGFQANAAGPLASYDGALIWKDEATMAIDFETSNAGTQATTTAMATFVSDTWTKVGFHFDGTATTSVVTPYVDVGAGWVAGTPQNITLAGLEEMHVVWGVKAGPTAAAETLQLDKITCRQLR